MIQQKNEKQIYFTFADVIMTSEKEWMHAQLPMEKLYRNYIKFTVFVVYSAIIFVAIVPFMVKL